MPFLSTQMADHTTLRKRRSRKFAELAAGSTGGLGLASEVSRVGFGQGHQKKKMLSTICVDKGGERVTLQVPGSLDQSDGLNTSSLQVDSPSYFMSKPVVYSISGVQKKNLQYYSQYRATHAWL